MDSKRPKPNIKARVSTRSHRDVGGLFEETLRHVRGGALYRRTKRRDKRASPRLASTSTSSHGPEIVHSIIAVA